MAPEDIVQLFGNLDQTAVRPRWQAKPATQQSSSMGCSSIFVRIDPGAEASAPHPYSRECPSAVSAIVPEEGCGGREFESHRGQTIFFFVPFEF